MSSETSIHFFTFDELKDIFRAHLTTQDQISNYPIEFLPLRSRLIFWIITICQKFHFKVETLYLTISIFDRYISSRKVLNFADIPQYKLITIACLSISTKINEVNANYIKFFTTVLLNSTPEHTYSAKDVYLTEMEILPSINYQVNSSNICQFNSIFRKICLAHIRSSKVKQSFSNVNSRLLKEFVLSGKSIGLSPVNGAIVVINATLKEFNENDMDMISAVMDIQNLNYSA